MNKFQESKNYIGKDSLLFISLQTNMKDITRPSALGMSDPLIESLEIPRKPSNPDNYQNSHFLGHLLWDTNSWENSLEPFLVTFFGDTFSSSIIPHLDAFLMMFHLPKQSPVELQKGGYFELTFQTNKCFGS